MVAMDKDPMRRFLERNQVAFLDKPSEITGHCFSDGAVQIVAASDLCFTSLHLSRGNAERLRDVLDRLVSDTGASVSETAASILMMHGGE
jgi:hypothetical protein